MVHFADQKRGERDVLQWITNVKGAEKDDNLTMDPPTELGLFMDWVKLWPCWVSHWATPQLLCTGRRYKKLWTALKYIMQVL